MSPQTLRAAFEVDPGLMLMYEFTGNNFALCLSRNRVYIYLPRLANCVKFAIFAFVVEVP